MAAATKAALHPRNYTNLLFWHRQDSAASDRYEGGKSQGRGRGERSKLPNEAQWSETKWPHSLLGVGLHLEREGALPLEGVPPEKSGLFRSGKPGKQCREGGQRPFPQHTES